MEQLSDLDYALAEKFNVGKDVANTPEATKEILITEKRQISEGGSFADGIYEITFRFGKDGRDFHLILKSFGAYGTAEYAQNIFNSMRKDGVLYIPGSYRIDKEKRIAIMRNLNHDGQIALSCNNPTIVAPELTMTKLPENFDDVLEKMIHYAHDSAEKGYHIAFDAFFYLLPENLDEREKNGQSFSVDFAVFDLDSIESYKVKGVSVEEVQSEYLVNNLFAIYRSLVDFADKYLTGELKERIVLKIKKRMLTVVDDEHLDVSRVYELNKKSGSGRDLLVLEEPKEAA